MMKKIYVVMMALLAVTVMQAQVTLVKDINPGSSGSSPAAFTEYNGEIFFVAETDTDGKEVWKTDGTDGGTVMVTDINPDGSSYPSSLIVYNNILHFSARPQGFSAGAALYKYDGSNVTKVVDIDEFSNPQEVGGKLYFVNNGKLWVYDGTNAPVAVTGGGSETIDNSVIIAYGNDILMYAQVTGGAGTGKELYKYSTEREAIEFVYEVEPEYSIPTNFGHAEITNFTACNGKIYFSALKNKAVLWETDGTETGTMQININPALEQVYGIYCWNNELYLKAFDGTSQQLYKYTPGVIDAVNVSNLGDAQNPVKFVTDGAYGYGDYLYVSGYDGVYWAYGLYAYDGTTFEKISTVPGASGRFIGFNDKIYLSAYDDGGAYTDEELYVYTPTPTAIGDEVNINAISVSPNPSYGMVNVSGIESATASYEIYDLSGKCIEKGMIGSSNQINYNVGAGMYILKVVDATNTKLTKILVK